jgi:hypothetical protein
VIGTDAFSDVPTVDRWLATYEILARGLSTPVIEFQNNNLLVVQEVSAWTGKKDAEN